MSVDTSVKVTHKAGFTAEDLEVLGDNRRARQIKNRSLNRLTKRLNLYTRSVVVTKDKTKLKVLEGKIQAIQFAIDTIKEV